MVVLLIELYRFMLFRLVRGHILSFDPANYLACAIKDAPSDYERR